MEKNLFILRKVTEGKMPEGPFYVIECFPYPQFVMDEEGIIKSFDEYREALEEVKDCQKGYVICF